MAPTRGFQVAPVQAAPLASAQLPILSGSIDPSIFKVDLVTPFVQGVAAGNSALAPLQGVISKITDEFDPDKKAEKAYMRLKMENETAMLPLQLANAKAKGIQTEIENAIMTGGEFPSAQGPLTNAKTTKSAPGAAPLSPERIAMRDAYNHKKFAFEIPGKLEGDEWKKNRIKRIGELNLPKDATDEQIAEAGKAATNAKGQQQWTDSDTKTFSAIEQADKDLENITAVMKDFDSGPISGRVAALNPWNIKVSQINNMVNGGTANLARGVFGEVGVLTDKDMKRYSELFPGIKTVKELMPIIIADLTEKLYNKRISSLNGLTDKNADVSRIVSRLQKEGKIVVNEDGSYGVPAEKMLSIRKAQGRSDGIQEVKDGDTDAYSKLKPGPYRVVGDSKTYIKK